MRRKERMELVTELRTALKADIQDAVGGLRTEFRQANEELRTEFRQANEGLRTEFRQANEELKQYIDEKIECDVMFVLREEMNTMNQSIIELAEKVDALDARTKTVHCTVLNRVDYIKELPMTEARIVAVETVTQRHTREIKILNQSVRCGQA